MEKKLAVLDAFIECFEASGEPRAEFDNTECAWLKKERDPNHGLVSRRSEIESEIMLHGTVLKSIEELYTESARSVLSAQLRHQYNESSDVLLPLVQEYLLHAGFPETAASIAAGLGAEIDKTVLETSTKLAALNSLDSGYEKLETICAEFPALEPVCDDYIAHSELLSNTAFEFIQEKCSTASDNEVLDLISEGLNPNPKNKLELQINLRHKAVKTVWGQRYAELPLVKLFSVYKEVLQEVDCSHPLEVQLLNGFLKDTALELSEEYMYHPNFVCPILRTSAKCLALTCGHLVSSRAMKMAEHDGQSMCPICRKPAEGRPVTRFI